MMRTAIADQIYTDLSGRLPGWAFCGLERVLLQQVPPLFGRRLSGGLLCGESHPELRETIPKDAVYGGLAASFGFHGEWLDWLNGQTFIATAEGEFLDLHAGERGEKREAGEADGILRQRVRSIADKVTDGALTAALHSVTYGQGEVFTLRYREGYLDHDFFDSGRRLGGDFLPLEVLRRREREAQYFDLAYWDLGCFDKEGELSWLRDGSSWNVALAVLPPLTVSSRTFFDVSFLDYAYYGDVIPDSVRYKRIRKLMEERRAAGVAVEILIESE